MPQPMTRSSPPSKLPKPHCASRMVAYEIRGRRRDASEEINLKKALWVAMGSWQNLTCDAFHLRDCSKMGSL